MCQGQLVELEDTHNKRANEAGTPVVALREFIYVATNRLSGYKIVMDLMSMQSDVMNTLVVRYCYIFDVDACGFGFLHLVS